MEGRQCRPERDHGAGIVGGGAEEQKKKKKKKLEMNGTESTCRSGRRRD